MCVCSSAEMLFLLPSKRRPRKLIRVVPASRRKIMKSPRYVPSLILIVEAGPSPRKTRLLTLFKLRALFRTGPVESVEFERGDRCEADGEFSQRSAISGGQDLPVLEVGDAAFDGGADTGEVLVCVDLGW